MSVQAALVEAPGIETLKRRTAFSGAWLTSSAMLASGLLIYIFHALAARTLGAAAYGQIAVLWAGMFLVVIVFFRPLEQTTSRTLAARLAKGEEVRTVVRSVTVLSVAILLGLTALFALAWGPLTDRIFLGKNVLTAMLLAGIAFYGLAYLVRGLIAGTGWFAGYGLGLMADSLARLGIGIPLVFVASQNVAAAAVAVAGLAGAIVPLWYGRSLLRSGLAGGSGAPFRFGAALGFALPAGAIAAADQVLVNGGPLLVMVGGGHNASKTAGVVFAATMLVRVPVYLFQGVAASILPNLTHLHTIEDAARFRRAVIQAATVLLSVGAVIAATAAAFGPAGMRTVYGSEFSAGRLELMLLGAGVGFYLAASAFSQALLALDRGVRAASAWIGSAALFVAVYAVLPGEQLSRISVAFAVAMFVDLLLLGILLVKRGSR